MIYPTWLAALVGQNTLPELENIAVFMDAATPTAPMGGATLTVFDPTGFVPV